MNKYHDPKYKNPMHQNKYSQIDEHRIKNVSREIQIKTKKKKNSVNSNIINMMTYTNKLDEIMRKYKLNNIDVGKALKTKEETISKHRNGKSPITWEMAQKYQNYFIQEHNIMVDSFILLTAKEETNGLCLQTVVPGKIPIIGQYVQSKHQAEMFSTDMPTMYLQSSMYNHYTFATAEDWGICAMIFVNESNASKPFVDLDNFFIEDYHYWLVLRSPMTRNYVHKSVFRNFSMAKIKDTKEIVCGQIYERPKRTRQAPDTYEIIDPLFTTQGKYLSEEKDYSSVELEWATPIMSSLMNVHAGGISIIEENNDIKVFD